MLEQHHLSFICTCKTRANVNVGSKTFCYQVVVLMKHGYARPRYKICEVNACSGGGAMTIYRHRVAPYSYCCALANQRR